MSTNLEFLENEIINCRKCVRLVEWREQVARVKRKAYQDWDYWGKPVPGFGDPQARVLVVGLAPGAHGSNRTGRQFTGDASGNFLYPALFRAGFASQPASTHLGDGLVLKDLFITAACRCAPPGNKPVGEELENCAPYLRLEYQILNPHVVVALGRIAFERVLKLISASSAPITAEGAGIQLLKPADFSHGAVFPTGAGTWLVSSYHPSQQNTQTGRLTGAMFDQVWTTVRKLLDG